MTKQSIYESVWKDEYIYDDNNIMAVISRLRKKLQTVTNMNDYIETVKGVGYRFNKNIGDRPNMNLYIFVIIILLAVVLLEFFNTTS